MKINTRASESRVPRGALVALTLLAVPTTLMAQDQGGQLEEITVTAQRREQSLQDVGMSITALGSEKIREMGITDSVDIGRVAPSVVVLPTSAGSAVTISMRGISQSDFSQNQEAPNSIYVDDVYLSSGTAASFSTYDLERIEVLRGPQGTLFGRNSTGGLARFISAKPTNDAEGYAEAGYGRYNRYWFEGAISGPLSDRVRGRLAGRREQADGWMENMAPGGKDSMETDAFGVRGQIEFDVTDDFLARLAITHQRQPNHRVGTYKSRNFYVDANGMPAPQPADLDVWGTGEGNNLIGYRDPYSDNRKSAFEDDGYRKDELTSPTLTMQWTLGSTTLTSVTNYTDFSYDYYEEDDGTPIDYVRSTSHQWLHQWSQELRGTGSFGEHIWTAGVYYLDIDTFVYVDFLFPVLAGSDFAFDDYQDSRQRTRSFAPFGQVEWQLSDRLTLTTGVRYTHDSKSFDSQVYFRELGNGYSGGTGSTLFPAPGLVVYDFRHDTVGNLSKQNEGLWSGKVQFDYRPNPDTLLYAGVSRGVKGAGFNTNLGGALTNEETPFGSESVTAYEVGGKFDLLDQRLRVNGSIYYYDYKDFQGFAFNGLQGVVSNYEGTFKGAELEIQATLPGDVLLTLAGSYADTTLSDVPTVYTGVRDVKAVMAPKWVTNGSIRKDFAVGAGTLSAMWNFDYLSDRYSSIDNNPATYVSESLVHNARLTYTREDLGIEFAAFVSNISDKQRQTMVYDLISTGGYTLNVYDKPRTWGVSVRKSF